MRAFFTDRRGGLSAGPYASLNLGPSSGDDPEVVAANWRLALGAAGLGGRPLALPRLVHGDRLVEGNAHATWDPATGPAPAARPEADAVFTRVRGLVLAVTAADCLPALIADPEAGTVAAVHAGWRGTRAGIVGSALRALAEAGHIRPDRTWVAFGPCLQPDALEVREDVAATLDPGFLVRRGGRTCFDLPGANRAQALAAGVRPERLRISAECALGKPARYFSWRRDGAATGRMAAFIALDG